jgi:DNA polymerase III delta prime subunit
MSMFEKEGKTKITPKAALLVCGEPGCGKSAWIRAQAKLKGAELFHWNIRVDRSLREGREVLHRQVRARQLMYVWLEGADDLTQEAQAFLRRILETASPNITCALEVREPWKLSPPILSRCTVINIPTHQSFRKNKNVELAKNLGLIKDTKLKGDITWKDISALRKGAVDPMAVLQECIEKYGWSNVNLQACIRGIGAGKSPWPQISLFLHQQDSGS